MQRIEFRAMGCAMLAAVDSEAAHAADQLAQAPRWFEEWEQCLSRFRPDSELSLLNASAAQATPVSMDLWEVVQAALHAASATEGLVTPTLLPALEAAGYDRTFEQIGAGDLRPPVTDWRGANSYSPPEPVADWRSIRASHRGRALLLPAGTRLDLGGIAKGWAADKAARRLRACGPALVDAGGDIAVSGPRADGQPWPIAIGNPLHPDKHLAVLAVAGGGVATSGRDYRRWRSGDEWRHHILDPRTGRPAQTDVLSATVVARSAVEAETAAKAALILGSEAGMAWLETRPSCAGLLVLEDGEMSSSRRMADFIWS